MRAGDVARLAVVTLGAAASIATPAPQYSYPRNYPVWQVESGGSFSNSCVSVETWVGKSGKQGIGLVLKLTPQTDRGCHLRIGGGRFVIGDVEVNDYACPFDVFVPPGGPQHTWVPFYFDNEKLWNQGHRRGLLELELTTDGMLAARLRINLVHRYSGPHRRVGGAVEKAYLP